MALMLLKYIIQHIWTALTRLLVQIKYVKQFTNISGTMATSLIGSFGSIRRLREIVWELKHWLLVTITILLPFSLRGMMCLGDVVHIMHF